MLSSAAESRLPAGFREVQWLQGTGTQYCETDIYPIHLNNQYTCIKGNITILDKVNSKFFIGAQWYQNYSGVLTEFGFSCNFDNAVFKIYYGMKSANQASFNLTNNTYPLDVHYEINENNLILNNSTQSKYETYITYNANDPILIGADNGTFPPRGVSNNLVRVKSFYVYDGTTLLYEFVPCYRKSDNKTGFCKITVADGSAEFFPNLSEEAEWIIGPIV